jgi:hypothetical protein
MKAVELARKVPRAAVLLSVQVAGFVTVLVGVASFSVPVALILGGVGVVAAVERQ